MTYKFKKCRHEFVIIMVFVAAEMTMQKKNLVCCSSISRSLEEPHLSEVILETVNKAPIILMVMLNIFTVFFMLLINSLLE